MTVTSVSGQKTTSQVPTASNSSNSSGDSDDSDYSTYSTFNQPAPKPDPGDKAPTSLAMCMVMGAGALISNVKNAAGRTAQVVVNEAAAIIQTHYNAYQARVTAPPGFRKDVDFEL